MHRAIAGTLTLAMILTGTSDACRAQQKTVKNQSGQTAGTGTGLEMLPAELARRVAKREREIEALGLLDAEKVPKGVARITTLWGPGYKELKVCFLANGSTQATRAKVAGIARAWNDAVPGLPFNFGTLSNPTVCGGRTRGEVQVRVSFDPGGSWSLSGSQSVEMAKQGEASLNIDGDMVKRAASDGELRQTVLHEFGHAYGLEHEHQHPAKACDSEYDWAAIYRIATGPPNNWSRAEVKEQMARLGKQGLMTTEFDRSSVMLYHFPPDYFVKKTQSRCYNERNERLSRGDTELAARLYPASTAERERVAEAVRQGHLETIRRANLADGARKSATDLIDSLIRKAPIEAGDAQK